MENGSNTILKGTFDHEGKNYTYKIEIDSQAVEHCDSPAHSFTVEVTGDNNFSFEWFYKRHSLNDSFRKAIESRKIVPKVKM